LDFFYYSFYVVVRDVLNTTNMNNVIPTKLITDPAAAPGSAAVTPAESSTRLRVSTTSPMLATQNWTFVSVLFAAEGTY
jgi:hypothetical protein